MQSHMLFLIVLLISTTIAHAGDIRKEVECVGTKLRQVCVGEVKAAGRYLGDAVTYQKNKDGSATRGFELNGGRVACWITQDAKDKVTKIICEAPPDWFAK